MIKEWIKQNKDKVRWINLFIRDFLLILAVGGLHYMTGFNSKVVFLITGMLVVSVSWHFSDLIKSIKISRGLNHGS